VAQNANSSTTMSQNANSSTTAPPMMHVPCSLCFRQYRRCVRRANGTAGSLRGCRIRYRRCKVRCEG
jgi:hypothetical protein